jgi:DinB superfamily
MDDLRKIILLDLLDQAFDRKAWHGPNLRGSIRGLDAEQAAWRPDPARKSIAEQVLHAAYWKYTVRRRLRGDKRGSFPLKGSNWFPVYDTLDEAGWRGHVRLLDEEHRALRLAIVELPADRWPETPAGSKFTYYESVQGIAAHDLYHAGQIQLLKRLRCG